MKLDTQARHDPAHGVWCRVCRTCFEAREGYAQTPGPSRDLTKQFKKLRRPVLERGDLELNRLIVRLDKARPRACCGTWGMTIRPALTRAPPRPPRVGPPRRPQPQNKNKNRKTV